MAVMASMVAHAEVEHNLGVQVGWVQQLYRLNKPSQYESDKTKLYKQPLNGGRIGFVYELESEMGMGLFTAINYAYTWHSSAWEEIPYTEEGQKSKFSGVEYQYQARAHTLDINLQAQYKFELADETFLGIYTGPSFQYIGKYESKDYFRLNDGNSRYYIDVPLEYNTEDMARYYKQWNFTWGLGLLFQYDIFYIRGGYDFGLVNPYKVNYFGDIIIDGKNAFEMTDGTHNPDDRLTRGRLDNWNITLGVFFWQSDK